MELPRAWVAAGANDQLWGSAGTYKTIPYDALPPVVPDPSFAWFAASAEHQDGMRLHEDSDPVDEHLAARIAEARAAGLTVPPSFVQFMTNEGLHSRVPSCTACYYDLGARLVPLPGHAGPERLLRFMNDQQACYLWYLLLEPGGAHRVTVATPWWRDGVEAPLLEDCADPQDVFVCASSFDEFIRRFWIENALWYAAQGGGPVEGELLAYAEAARTAAPR
jgi:hypothetical protein